MSKYIKRQGFAFFSLLFIIIIIGKLVIIAQEPITGEWRTDDWSTKKAIDSAPEWINLGQGKDIHLTFERRLPNGKNSHGSNFSFSELQGLTREQAQNGSVSFRLVREAGTVECQGTFTNGKGSGTFTFTPSTSYLAAMKSRGFDFANSSFNSNEGVSGKALSAALINVTTALADDLKSVDIGVLDVEDLFKAAIFRVDSKFMAEMKASGYQGLKMEDLVKARIFKIDAEFVRKMNDMGFGGKDFEKMVKFSIFKVTPEYLSELKAAGFNNLSSEDVVQFRIFKVTPELLNTLKSEGFDNLSAEQVVKFRIFNIDREFIRAAKVAEPKITVDQLVEMKIGVRRRKNDN
ncbi:MAG: hypothetical protein WKF34_00300 [Pyrinomonadaceae bacterium]